MSLPVLEDRSILLFLPTSFYHFGIWNSNAPLSLRFSNKSMQAGVHVHASACCLIMVCQCMLLMFLCRTSPTIRKSTLGNQKTDIKLQFEMQYRSCTYRITAYNRITAMRGSLTATVTCRCTVVIPEGGLQLSAMKTFLRCCNQRLELSKLL